MKKNTLIIDLNSENKEGQDSLIDRAAEILRNGGTVIFPTETVYGLGANAMDAQAAQKIYRAKGRPSDNPLIVHIENKERLSDLVKDVGKREEQLMEAFWPGPLTIIFEKNEKVPLETTGGLGTVAVRMPSDTIARMLIRKAGVAVAAPSANLSGSPSITCGEYILREMKGRVDAIILHRDSEIGLESTVIDMTQEQPVILRPGKVTKREIEEVLGVSVVIDPALNDPDQIPKSPGMKYRHYSPKANIIIVMGASDQEKFKKSTQEIERLLAENQKIEVLVLEHRLSLYPDYGISIGKDIEEAAQNIFRLLRMADEKNIDWLIFESIDEEGIAEALMNRMIKAAGNNVI